MPPQFICAAAFRSRTTDIHASLRCFVVDLTTACASRHSPAPSLLAACVGSFGSNIGGSSSITDARCRHDIAELAVTFLAPDDALSATSCLLYLVLSLLWCACVCVCGCVCSCVALGVCVCVCV
jgi:hypothetical protein